MKDMDWMKDLKKSQKEIKKGTYEFDGTLQDAKRIYDNVEMNMARYEEEMTWTQADKMWEAFDTIKAFLFERFPEFKKEKEEKEARIKAAFDKDVASGKIIVGTFGPI